MNTELVESPWMKIKSEIQTVWNQITGDELEQSRGHLMSLTAVIQEKYDHEKDEVIEKLQHIFAKFGQSTDDIAQDFK